MNMPLVNGEKLARRAEAYLSDEAAGARGVTPASVGPVWIRIPDLSPSDSRFFSQAAQRESGAAKVDSARSDSKTHPRRFLPRPSWRIPPVAFLAGIIAVALALFIMLMRDRDTPSGATDTVAPPWQGEVPDALPAVRIEMPLHGDGSVDKETARAEGRAYPETSAPWPDQYEAKLSPAPEARPPVAEFEGTIKKPEFKAQHEPFGSSIH